MKNGDPRSLDWIRRNLKTYKRDNEQVQTLLCLVNVAPIPSVHEIETWTPEQCLLACDWAGAVHLSASDNNNRVPAIPPHLVAYRPTYPGRGARRATIDAVNDMRDDNGTCFHPTAAQWKRLEEGMAVMIAAGCRFTDAEISLFGSGEDGEFNEHFQQFKGFDIARQAMLEIFEALDDEGVPEGPAGVRLHEPAAA